MVSKELFSSSGGPSLVTKLLSNGWGSMVSCHGLPRGYPLHAEQHHLWYSGSNHTNCQCSGTIPTGIGNNTKSATTIQCHEDYQSMIPTLRRNGCKVTNSAGPPLLIEGQVYQELVNSEGWTWNVNNWHMCAPSGAWKCYQNRYCQGTEFYSRCRRLVYGECDCS